MVNFRNSPAHIAAVAAAAALVALVAVAAGRDCQRPAEQKEPRSGAE